MKFLQNDKTDGHYTLNLKGTKTIESLAATSYITL